MHLAQCGLESAIIDITIVTHSKWSSYTLQVANQQTAIPTFNCLMMPSTLSREKLFSGWFATYLVAQVLLPLPTVHKSLLSCPQ